MSFYGLIKETNRIMRMDTICDLRRVNAYLSSIGRNAIVPYGQSLRALENSVALGVEGIDNLPKLERGHDFYKGIISEVKETEKKRYYSVNQTTQQ